MNRRADSRRRVTRLRRETLRVLDAAELDVVVGAGRDVVVVGARGDGVIKVVDEGAKGPSRYCNA